MAALEYMTSDDEMRDSAIYSDAEECTPNMGQGPVRQTNDICHASTHREEYDILPPYTGTCLAC